MSLFGAMTSGVSGLSAQSSAMAAIADNISNVNTVGYKNAKVDFQTLVTRQATPTDYSAGGVQSRPRTQADMQGVLQASASDTNLAISGNGFFVVNPVNRPGVADQFMFTRAGSFTKDSDGYLRNTGGYYLQAWPTDPDGNVALPTGSSAAFPNQNTISTEYLQSVNLNRVTGTAVATSRVSSTANLPATSPIGASHSIDAQFFDTLGASNGVSFTFTKAAINRWDLTVEPPTGTSVVSLYDGSDVYRSIGQLEFTAVPDAGQSIAVGGNTYTFVNGAPGAREIRIDGGRSVADVVADLATVTNLDLGGAASVKAGKNTVLLLTGGGSDIAVDPNGVTAAGAPATRQTASFTVLSRDLPAGAAAIDFSADGLPQRFRVTTMSVVGFENGAAPMNGTADLDGDGRIDVPVIGLDFGDPHQADGFTQFGTEFTPGMIEQNGARFGVFNGISISQDGVMSALFDNGERRPIYRLPLATFVNPEGLIGRAGNAWIATEESGNPTLRVADSGPAGKIEQSSLEASTVDIGEEFTNMIIVQRAYSAATKIISTADDMLEELVRIKR
jgi:flagellar hook protein FlgE